MDTWDTDGDKKKQVEKGSGKEKTCCNLATLRCSRFCVSPWRRTLVDSSSSCCCSVKPQAPPTHRAEVRALLCATHSPCQSTATHTHWCLSASPEPFTWESLSRRWCEPSVCMACPLSACEPKHVVILTHQVPMLTPEDVWNAGATLRGPSGWERGEKGRGLTSQFKPLDRSYTI